MNWNRQILRTFVVFSFCKQQNVFKISEKSWYASGQHFDCCHGIFHQESLQSCSEILEVALVTPENTPRQGVRNPASRVAKALEANPIVEMIGRRGHLSSWILGILLKLSFLNTLEQRSTQSFSFVLYRKPTRPNMYLHYYSWQSETVKRSTVISMFLFALRVCDPQFLNREVIYLKTLLF